MNTNQPWSLCVRAFKTRSAHMRHACILQLYMDIYMYMYMYMHMCTGCCVLIRCCCVRDAREPAPEFRLEHWRCRGLPFSPKIWTGVMGCSWGLQTELFPSLFTPTW